MRRLLLAAVAAVCVALPASSKADSEFRNGADVIRLTANACKDEKVLAFVPESDRLDYREASATVGGTVYAGCWKPHFNQQVVHLYYEDGDQGVIPFGALKPVKSV